MAGMGKMNRREFVASIGATMGTMAAPSSGVAMVESAVTVDPRTQRRPNVIVMICDDLGYGDLGCYGSKLRTPNLDRMAAEGARFTRHNTPHPICSASRSALLTGRYATRTGTDPVYYPFSKGGLATDEKTLADVLHTAGYRSMCVGKWHLGSQPEYLPTRRGFDEYFGVPYSVDMQPLPMIRNESVVEANTDRSLLTPRYTDAAVHFIEDHSEKPFFLYLAYSYPHVPIDASPRFKGKSGKGIYGDAVQEIDWSVGEILSALNRKGIEKDTLVLFTGDHGPWFEGSSGLLRGRKGTTYEGGCRVPMLARWKSVIPPGRVVDAPASHLDILPTLTALCGAEAPDKPLDGVDIRDVLTGKQETVPHPPMLYFSPIRAGHELQCVRKDQWKLRFAQWTSNMMVLGGSPGENLMLANPELYDVVDDPTESYDVASVHPEIVRDLQQVVDAQVAKFPAKTNQAYQDLKARHASPTTPAGAGARAANYSAGPNHFDGNPN